MESSLNKKNGQGSKMWKGLVVVKFPESAARQNAIFCFALCSLLLLAFYVPVALWRQTATRQPHYKTAGILISYAYFEKDAMQRGNFELFLKAGVVPSPTGQSIHWAFVLSTDTCTPCKGILPKSSKMTLGPEHLGIKRSATFSSHTLIYRTENIGMDIGSHNVTIGYFKHTGQIRRYRYFFMINSSAKGPFLPSYLPLDWHWTHAYLVRFRNDVHAVASSIVCLPAEDEGGPGPRIESWAYAVDELGLQALQEVGAYDVRACKGCKTGIIVAGEYSIGLTMIKFGYNMATLMAKYAEDVDWRDPVHWKCNDNVHPSRHGTYDGIAFHPFETVFVKSSWHVADPYTKRYSVWKAKHLAGLPGTEGTFDPNLYRFAISENAQRPNQLAKGYDITPAVKEWLSKD